MIGNYVRTHIWKKERLPFSHHSPMKSIDDVPEATSIDHRLELCSAWESTINSIVMNLDAQECQLVFFLLNYCCTCRKWRVVRDSYTLETLVFSPSDPITGSPLFYTERRIPATSHPQQKKKLIIIKNLNQLSQLMGFSISSIMPIK